MKPAKFSRITRLTLSSALTVTAVALSPSLLAQGEEVIEEVLVTATQRARPVQDIPVSVNSVEAEELEMSGTSDIRGLQSLAPSFHLSSSTSESAGTTARIRGIGTQGNNPGLESSVGILSTAYFAIATP